ncbi:MAG: anthranilate phosphoribosyltransferase [Pseudomonadota bacterium]|jgi:anthranilate phosphoribosyltransferase
MTQFNSPAAAPLAVSSLIREIGRGKHGARDLSRQDAYALYDAMQSGQVADLELGAILIALRIKGESVDEIAGFLQAAQDRIPPLQAPVREYAPILIPSYNGARKVANLTPLLALLLARAGAPVLMHGVTQDPGRVTSADILQAMGYTLADTAGQAQQQLEQHNLAFMPVASLAPQMASLLNLRQRLGLRNSTHTLVKIVQPFAQPALRLCSYTHPEYLEMLGQYFTTQAPVAAGDVFLMRGTEGETVANAKRANQIDWFHQGQRSVMVEKQAPVDEWPPMPAERDAATTAQWIAAALRGEVPIPEPIQVQVAHCLQVARTLRP